MQRLLSTGRSAWVAVRRAARMLDAVRTGWTQGLPAGLAREARLFAEAVVDPDGGKAGIRAFFDKRARRCPRGAA